MTPEQIAEEISKLHTVELVRLKQILRDNFGWGDGGVRVPGPGPRPRRPLDARGVSLDARTGKHDVGSFAPPLPHTPLPPDGSWVGA